MTRPLHVAVVGATGNVGRTMLEVLDERRVPIASLRVVASSASAGRQLRACGRELVVESLDGFDPSGVDVALFSAGGSVAMEHAGRFAASGCIVIDNSSAFRMDPRIPLIVPEVNAAALTDLADGIIANPNCSTIQLVMALAPLHAEWGLARVQVTTMQSTSGTGRAAMEELRTQTAASLAGTPHELAVYPHPIAFNVLPHCDVFIDGDETREERKIVEETRKILGLAQLRISATCTRVPVFVGHSEAVHVELDAPATAADVRSALTTMPGVRVIDDPASSEYPQPTLAAGDDDVLVGRIRRDHSIDDGRGIAMFVVADNLRKGAATNSVQIIEALAAAGRWA